MFDEQDFLYISQQERTTHQKQCILIFCILFDRLLLKLGHSQRIKTLSFKLPFPASNQGQLN